MASTPSEKPNHKDQNTCLAKAINRWNALQSQRRCWLFKGMGIEVGTNCTINQGVTAKLRFTRGAKGCIQIGSRVTLEQGVVLDTWGGEIAIAENVFIGPYVVIYGHGGVTIGSNTLISMHCRILSSNHTIPERDRAIRDCPDLLLPTTIGTDVWLGAGVTVLGGVTIAEGCVIGAGAVVTKDLPPYSIAVGVPARVIKQR